VGSWNAAADVDALTPPGGGGVPVELVKETAR